MAYLLLDMNHSTQIMIDTQNVHFSKSFDPIRFLLPFIIQWKVLHQEIWLIGSELHEPLLGQLNDEITEWQKNLTKSSTTQIPRCLQFLEET